MKFYKTGLTNLKRNKMNYIARGCMYCEGTCNKECLPKQKTTMENEFVSYEIALKLKELDFDEQCICGYNDYHLLRSKISSSFDGDFVRWDEKYDKDLKAPLYQQVFRWFREKYGIYMYPKKFDVDKWWVEWGDWNSSICETYEEAEYEWLLKMIEIAKN